MVRLRESDPPAPTLALAAGVALFDAASPYLRRDDVVLKWPNDFLVGSRKLAGILLERVEAAVVIGVGANLASHPQDVERPATSIAAEASIAPPPDIFLADLSQRFAAALSRWRSGLADIRDDWLARAHPIGTPLSTHDPSGGLLTGTFDGLDERGACRLRLADGEVRLIHAGDLFLVS